MISAGRTVCDTSRAAVKVFEDDLLTLDHQLTDTTCQATVLSKDESSQRKKSLRLSDELTDEPVPNAGSFGEDRVIRVTTHMQLLV